ncbi:MAG: hypothetical protein ACLQVL_27680 [Terriglobia bacterium]
MRTHVKLVVLFLALATVPLLGTPAFAQDAPADVDSLVRGFPTLDQLEAHLGAATPVGDEGSRPPSTAHANTAGQGSVFPVSARWFTAPPLPDPFAATTATSVKPAEKPLATLLADMDAEHQQAATLAKQITAQNDLPINRYLLDRVAINATTMYGTNVTGLFVNGVGFGSTEQTFRQSYAVTYTLPLLRRYKEKTNWTRILSGYNIVSSVGVMPLINPTLQVQQFLNNLQLTWSVSFTYDLSSATLRKLRDGQYDQEAALLKSTARAATARDELLNKMALRIDALSANRPVRDTRVTSLRELYPQFELYQTRYEQAASCDDRMEDFFTLKGLALSLLTLSDYDRADQTGTNLLQAWKKAQFVGCGRT